MSDSGRDDAERLSEDDPRLTSPHHHHPEADDHDASGHEHAGHEPEAYARRRFPFAHLSSGTSAKWLSETRFGIAALLSFLILVSVLIMNKGWKTKSTAPVMTIASAGKPGSPSGVDGSKEKPKETPRGETTAPTGPPPAARGTEAPTAKPEAEKPAGETPTPKAAEPDPTLPAPADTPPESTPLPQLPAASGDGPAAATPPANAPPPADVAPAEPPIGNAPTPAPAAEPEVNLPAPTPETPLPAAGSAELLGAPNLPVAEKVDTVPPPSVNPASPAPATADTSNPGTAEPPAAASTLLAPPAQTQGPAPAPSEEKPSASQAKPNELPNLAPSPASTDPPPTPPASPETASGNWIPLPNVGKGRLIDDDPPPRAKGGTTATDSTATHASEEIDQVEPVPHVVQSGENFWTISRQYYNTGRYYRALWKANSRLVPAPDKLVVGMTIRIPPPEALDRSLIEPARTTGTPETSPFGSPSRTARPTVRGSQPGTPGRRGSEVELALPIVDPFTERRAPTPEDPDSAPEVRSRASHPLHKVLKHETLRSIARDTLGDSRRYQEILELNRDVIDDPYELLPGQLLKLPADAQRDRRSASRY